MIPFLGLPGVPAIEVMYWTLVQQVDKILLLVAGTPAAAYLEQLRETFLTILRAYGWSV
jgi:hypothetical protein